MSGRDVAVFVGLIVAFVVLVTVHVWIVIGLASRPPRWRAPLAFFVAPMAPFFALREHMIARGVTWIASAVLYVVALVMGRS